MGNIEHNDIIGNYKIKGKVLTLEAIAEQFYFTSIIPQPFLLMGKPDQPYCDKLMYGKCFSMAIVMQKAIGGTIVNAFIISSVSEDSTDLTLVPHGIIIKDNKIIDPINHHAHPGSEIPYLIPKRIRKPKLSKLIVCNYITLTKDKFNTLFPTYINKII